MDNAIADFKVVDANNIMEYIAVGFKLYGFPFCCDSVPLQGIIKFEESE